MGRGAADVESLRVFCAVELPSEVRAAAAAHAARLRRDFPDARASWVRPQGLHVTLKFIGELEPARLESLTRAAAAAAWKLGPFELSIEGAGTFPPKGVARVLWLGVRDASGQLARLQGRLETASHAAGFPHEAKRFNPHLTVARLRQAKGADELSEAHRRSAFGPYTFSVSELVVMRSELGPGGSRYTALSRHALAG
jgi:RNA 2',3'-cyclic 3'-phosphodiesterase